MTRIRLIGSAFAAVLVLFALMASSAAAEEWVAGPELKATGTTLEWTAVPGATTYQLYWSTEKDYPYKWSKLETSTLSATPPVETGQNVRYLVKSVTPKSYFSNTMFIHYHLFASEKYPSTVKAKQTDFQGFQITGSVSVCKKLTAEGKSGAAAETLEVHPIYTECEIELGKTLKAKTTTEGCNYLFHVNPNVFGLGNKEGARKGTSDVVCEAGKEIVVHVEGIEGGCEIKVPPQLGLKNIEYVNEGAGTGRKVQVNANVTGIKWSATGACGLKESSGSNGEYREGKFSALGIPELGTGPAGSASEAFNELSEAQGSLVE
jgi:hypothetical protein